MVTVTALTINAIACEFLVHAIVASYGIWQAVASVILLRTVGIYMVVFRHAAFVKFGTDPKFVFKSDTLIVFMLATLSVHAIDAIFGTGLMCVLNV